MKLDEIMATAVEPALAWLPPKMTSPEAIVMLLAIGLQESRFEHRYQVLNDPNTKGPARSFWQAELGGGMVTGVMNHAASSAYARAAILEHGVEFKPRAVWLAIEYDDELAAILARLLLWTEPGMLPRVTAEADAWTLYLRAWRPGAYARGDGRQRAELRAKWGRNHRAVRTFFSYP